MSIFFGILKFCYFLQSQNVIICGGGIFYKVALLKSKEKILLFLLRLPLLDTWMQFGIISCNLLPKAILVENWLAQPH